MRFLRAERPGHEVPSHLLLGHCIRLFTAPILAWLELRHLLGVVVRVADQSRKFIVPNPCLIMFAHPALSVAVQDDDDLFECQIPEVAVLQASSAPLAEQFIKWVYAFGLFFARSPFPDASADACG